MRILKEYCDNKGNIKSIDVEIEIGESQNYIISSLKKTNPNIIVNFIPNKIHINQYDNIYLHRGDYSINKKTSSIGKTYPMTSVQSKEPKKVKLQSVQCRGISRDPFPVSHSRRCENKTQNANGLCYLHKYQDTNTINGVYIGPHTLKYWKD